MISYDCQMQGLTCGARRIREPARQVNSHLRPPPACRVAPLYADLPRGEGQEDGEHQTLRRSSAGTMEAKHPTLNVDGHLGIFVTGSAFFGTYTVI
jgi:hypothetical protein